MSATEGLTELLRKGFKEQLERTGESDSHILVEKYSHEQLPTEQAKGLTDQPTEDTSQKSPALVSHRLFRTGIGRNRG